MSGFLTQTLRPKTSLGTQSRSAPLSHKHTVTPPHHHSPSPSFRQLIHTHTASYYYLWIFLLTTAFSFSLYLLKGWQFSLVKKACAGIFKPSMGARNRVGIELSYRPARLHRLAEFIPWNRFLGSINV
jgi:hypothetical protein